MSNNLRFADNQQVSKMKDEYFAGFVDGEGCFYIGFSKRADLKMTWQIITEFHVSQNSESSNVLIALKERLGCGYLKPNHPKSKKDRSWILIVKDRNDLQNKVIPFFEKYRLHTNKYIDFQIFKETLGVIEQKAHLQKEGFEKIVNLVFSTSRITNKKYTKDVLLSS